MRAAGMQRNNRTAARTLASNNAPSTHAAQMRRTVGPYRLIYTASLAAASIANPAPNPHSATANTRDKPFWVTGCAPKKCSAASTVRSSVRMRQNSQKPFTANAAASGAVRGSGAPRAAANSAACTAKNNVYTPHSTAMTNTPISWGRRGRAASLP